jgi:membrane-bound lytic murein transglycosylase D
MRGISPKFLRWNKFFLVLFLALSYPLVQANTDSLSMQQRMNKLDEQSDIHFVLNNLVKEKITEFGKQKKLIALCMADGELYFPLIEAEFSKNKIPLELKYITVMESHVNPAAGHSDGPAGLWQITNGTGKVMGLRNDKYIDDRRTPQASTKAVSAYFAKLYKMYGDWQLAITAYQIGNGTLDKIIAKHGKKDYWSLRPYLPKFASDYMAKYFAVCYVMENYESFGIVPYAGKYNASKLDTVHITQALGFERMAQALGIPKSEISKLNPQFKQHFFPAENGIYAVLPSEAAKVFNEDPKKIYNFAMKKIMVQNQSVPKKKSTKKPAKKKKK